MSIGTILTKEVVLVRGVGQVELEKVFWGLHPTLPSQLFTTGFWETWDSLYRVKPKHIPWEGCSGRNGCEQLTSLWSLVHEAHRTKLPE